VLATSGCVLRGPDIGPPSPDIALARTADGTLQVLGNMCSSELESVVIGTGDNSYAEGEVTLEPTGTPGRHVVIDLADPGPEFTVTDGDSPAELAVPIFVRLKATDGIWAGSVFEELPQPGEAMFAPYFGDGDVVAHPIDDYPAESPDCG